MKGGTNDNLTGIKYGILERIAKEEINEKRGGKIRKWKVKKN